MAKETVMVPETVKVKRKVKKKIPVEKKRVVEAKRKSPPPTTRFCRSKSKGTSPLNGSHVLLRKNIALVKSRCLKTMLMVANVFERL